MISLDSKIFLITIYCFILPAAVALQKNIFVHKLGSLPLSNRIPRCCLALSKNSVHWDKVGTFKVYVKEFPCWANCTEKQLSCCISHSLLPHLGSMVSMSDSWPVRLMTCWLWVWDPVEVNFLSGVLLSLTSAEACQKSSWWLWKEDG